MNLNPISYVQFALLFNQKTALYMAVQNNNVEIVKSLLMSEDIDVNIPYILTFFYFNIILYLYNFNYILNIYISMKFISYIFQFYLLLYIRISFSIIQFNII